MKLNLRKSITEKELVEGCKKRKQLAQKQVYERYSGKMLAVVCRYIKDRNEAEEVMIGGLMKVFEKIDQFKEEGSFEGWIRRICVNESLTYLRKNKYMYAEVEIEKADASMSFQQIEDQLEAEDLLKIIQELPVGYRTVFNLYAIDGYNHAEISEQLGINVNTSKSQLSRARALLQKQLTAIEADINNKIFRHE